MPVRDPYLFHEALMLPGSALAYHVSERLATQYPSRFLLEGAFHAFDVWSYAEAGFCRVRELSEPHGQRAAMWTGAEGGIEYTAENVWYEIEWEGERFDFLVLTWSSDHGTQSYHFLLADGRAVAERLVDVVCTWTSELRDEVLVFEAGHWHKDEALFRSIKGATLDNLVLRGSLKEEIYADINSFFLNKETYLRYQVPWKRGILLVGPPGNGKTHAVKALVNALGQDCLYVKSFRSQAPDEYNIRAVFVQARKAAPCILVLEDLDSLVTSHNRSFFLNELDGFAGNDGILTLATTNHPERLDPAIVDRPSRFDRKYPFDLPRIEERARYIGMWSGTLQRDLQLTDEAVRMIAEQAEDFSFAYLKELFVSAMMRWINAPVPGAMGAIMLEQVAVLREQMASAIVFEEPAEDGGDLEMMPAQMQRFMARSRPGRFRTWWPG